MRADPRFGQQPKSFWACVRSLSQHTGYSKGGAILVPSAQKMADAFAELGLNSDSILANGQPTPLGSLLHEYFAYRADVLMNYVEPRLMNAGEAKALFEQYKQQLSPKCPVPMNKQKGDKKAEAFLTGLVNMIVESRIGPLVVDYDPRELTTFTGNGVPLRTLARRVDGAFPSTVNPVAIWEIKEYYYTTTFGSRVADGVYETLLDGMELESLRDDEGFPVEHVLAVDAHFTWWKCGKPYLCRIIDMLHMGYVTEVLFGREVVERLPLVVDGWVASLKATE